MQLLLNENHLLKEESRNKTEEIQ